MGPPPPRRDLRPEIFSFRKPKLQIGVGMFGREDTMLSGYALEFSSDPNQQPRWHGNRSVITLGKDWMREYTPNQWAAYCAARMTGEDMRSVPEDVRTIIEAMEEE